MSRTTQTQPYLCTHRAAGTLLNSLGEQRIFVSAAESPLIQRLPPWRRRSVQSLSTSSMHSLDWCGEGLRGLSEQERCFRAVPDPGNGRLCIGQIKCCDRPRPWLSFLVGCVFLSLPSDRICGERAPFRALALGVTQCQGPAEHSTLAPAQRCFLEGPFFCYTACERAWLARAQPPAGSTLAG